jgi:hypothetical protein
MFKFVVTVSFVSLFAGNLGCKKLLKKVVPMDGGTTTTEGTESSGSAQAQADDPDELLEDKLEPYIDCVNSLSSAVRRSARRYLSTVQETGPTGKERSVNIPKLPNGAAAKCTENVAKGKTMQPSNPELEQAGDAFAKAANNVEPLVAQLSKYFDDKDYRDDNWAKAKTLHPQLMAAFSESVKASNDLHNTLDGITKPLKQRTLARIEKEEGKGFRYHRQHVLLTARDLVDASHPSQDSNVDFNLYSATMTDFEKALEDLTTYGNSHKSDLKDRKLARPGAESNYNSFMRAANDYQKAQKNFWRCLREAPAKAKLENGKVDVEKAVTIGKIPGCPRPVDSANDASKKFNEFIRTSNSHQFP